MDRGDLLQVLRDALNPASDNFVRIREETSELPPDIADAIFLHTISRPIETVLSRAEPFQGGGGFLVQRDNGYSGFHANEASIALSRRILRGETPEQAVGWLERTLATDHANGIGVLALWGVQIASRIELESGVTLLLFCSLPDSSTKSWFTQPRDPATFPGFLSLFASPPGAALVCSHTVSPFLHAVKHGAPPAQTEPFKIQSLLDDARLALTLVGPCCPVSAGYWFEFEDPDLSDAPFYSGISTSHQEVLPWGFAPDVDLDGGEARRLMSAFLGNL